MVFDCIEQRKAEHHKAEYLSTVISSIAIEQRGGTVPMK